MISPKRSCYVVGGSVIGRIDNERVRIPEPPALGTERANRNSCSGSRISNHAAAQPVCRPSPDIEEDEDEEEEEYEDENE
jgi:hypothetical protein